ncbi:HvnC protein [Franconibacter daqui]|uniref:HvnC protein n=1 Tax=Franconibacter daqui TaxID=2047724 RepID=A0ABV1PHJ9_9ENTR
MKKSTFTLYLSLILAATGAQAQTLKEAKAEYLKTHPARLARPSGQQTAEYLNTDYADTEKDCGSSSTPAFLCSGNLIRGTDVFSTQFHAWDPSPSSQSSGGVSFSYLRADSKFSSVAYDYNNGFIFYPYFWAPDNEGIDTNIDIMCAFPVDGWTVYRSDAGCGASSDYPQESVPCQEQGIYTADQWYAHFEKGGENHLYMCGFTTSDYSSEDTAAGFYQSILSRAKIESKYFSEQNELRLATWAQGKQDSLPIEAFFYIVESSSGLDSARKNQQDFYNTTTNHIWVPVIKLTLPQSPGGNAVFSYSAADQLIPEPVSQQ